MSRSDVRTQRRRRVGSAATSRANLRLHVGILSALVAMTLGACTSAAEETSTTALAEETSTTALAEE
ncbi:MAG: hypothetical protein ABFR89_11300, partial [Actinomycetota bacterium]